MEPEVRRTEVVSVRLTPAERARLDAMGGPSALRGALERAPIPPSPGRETSYGASIARTFMVWADGSVGQQWPASATF